ncbi:histidinol dehydrogenase [Afifella sp. IM 167]|uniref:histidinol dehydrogenase n=1 Tax=Afifella sp. IM 167 TaxID=2033586 RepID=UPI001CCC62DA|nr:histidinol dehydrogenase [Afifella sp. IM 167]MBZ8135115.1 histidinol dehydrogenase [Afifella sp. IM 167]
MAQFLSTSDADFQSRFSAFLAAKREAAADVDEAVREIIADVRARGDAALAELTLRFDKVDIDKRGMRISAEEIRQAVADCPEDILAALTLARDRLKAGQERLMPADTSSTDALGVRLGTRWSAVDSAGLYVPGGTAAYPSSVIMNAVPAKVAGVERLVMTVPTPDGVFNPLVLVAAEISGVDEIYRIGGAQAIAALAYGTETISPVAMICGPGNAYVAAAKRRVFGQVGIDMIAGPSEILVIADAENDPAWLAADLLSQAEHDAVAQSILITDDATFGRTVAEEVERQLELLPRKAIAGASWRDYGAVITVADFSEAARLADRIAAEHLEICTDRPEALLEKIRHAGAVFLGRTTPEVIGDYVGGSNHVLPTARSARFSSGLSVLDFLKRSSILSCPPEALAELGPAAVALARAEGLEAHARAITIRMNR